MALRSVNGTTLVAIWALSLVRGATRAADLAIAGLGAVTIGVELARRVAATRDARLKVWTICFGDADGCRVAIGDARAFATC